MEELTEEIEKKQLKHFAFFTVFPEIICGILLLLCAAYGLMQPTFNGEGIKTSVIIWIIGTVITAVIYFLLKAISSYYVLSVYYLKKISNDIEKIKKHEQE